MGNGQSGIGGAVRTLVDFIPSVLSGLVGIFYEPPEESNDTLLAIEEYRRQEGAHRQQERAVEERFREREAAVIQRGEAALAAAQKTYEEAAQLKAETAAAAARQVEEAACRREEAAKQIEEAARQREEALRLQELLVEQRFLEREAATIERGEAALAAAQKTYEEAAKVKAETAAAVARQVEEAARQREEAALLSAKQIEEAARQREEAALLSAKKIEEAARQREEATILAAQQLEEAARLREEAALLAAKQIEASAREKEESARAEASKAQEDLQRGIRPVVMPTQDEVAAAKKRIKYDPSKLHFAVCGSSGSGKSTVINAVRGLRNKSAGAAGVGVTETTSQITRYPDPRKELPYSRFVWFDIPGAGTIRVPDWQYFNDQGLFVFDFIIMVYDVRFTKIDVGIIENCLRFNIPVFIVRSKADQHISNMIQSETDCKPRDTEYDQIYEEMSTRYVKETRADFYQHMEHMASNEELDERDRQLLNSQRVYIISGSTLRLFLSESKADQMERAESKPIDEVNLVDEMLRAAARRRYPKTTVARSWISTKKEALGATFAAMNFSTGFRTGSEKQESVDPKPAEEGIADPGASLAGASTPVTAIPHDPSRPAKSTGPIPSRAGALTLDSHAPAEDSLEGEMLDPIASGNEEYVLLETDEMN